MPAASSTGPDDFVSQPSSSRSTRDDKETHTTQIFIPFNAKLDDLDDLEEIIEEEILKTAEESDNEVRQIEFDVDEEEIKLYLLLVWHSRCEVLQRVD